MKHKVDILIRYEHKVREFESIMLLKIEMERRGYSVAFVANYDYKNNNRYDPKLIVSPAIYSDSQLVTDISKYGLKKKIANLLWEQVTVRSHEESPTSPQNVYGTGQKAIAFCWGKNTQRRLMTVGMPEENAKVVGLINTDFLRGPFAKLLSTKEQLAKKYDINVKARWNLFVSSFAYCELDKIQENLIRKEFGDKFFEDYTNISVESRKILLVWFEELLKRYPEDILIYRPHPDEMGKSKELERLKSCYPNFYVISDLSLKHWFNAVDKIYNWHSTGIIDGIILNKPCRMLRPCVISKEYDYKLFDSASQIKELNELLEDYDSMDTTIGLDRKKVEDYYFMPRRYVYQEICDVLEDMLNTDKYDIHYSKAEKRFFRKVYLKTKISRSLDFIKPLLRKLHLFKEAFEKSDIHHKALEAGYKKNVATEEEISLLYNQLKPIVYGQ